MLYKEKVKDGYKGRNGYGHCTGILATAIPANPTADDPDLVAIHPVNSRKQIVYSCIIYFPANELENVIAELRTAAKRCQG